MIIMSVMKCSQNLSVSTWSGGLVWLRLGCLLTVWRRLSVRTACSTIAFPMNVSRDSKVNTTPTGMSLQSGSPARAPHTLDSLVSFSIRYHGKKNCVTAVLFSRSIAVHPNSTNFFFKIQTESFFFHFI